MAVRGRPKKAGKRNAKGRLSVVHDRGNEMVQRRSAAFARCREGKADQQLYDQIGRLWAVGLLDGHGCDGAILRDAGRRYAQLYWHEFAQLAPRVGQSERKSRTAANDGGSNAAAALFKALDDMARTMGHHAVSAMHGLCVDGWWFPDTNTAWVDRLINEALVKHGAPVRGFLVLPGDDERLLAAIATLLAMVGGNHAAKPALPPRSATA